VAGPVRHDRLGRERHPDNARKCPEVDACVGLIEDTVATVPLDFYERVSDTERQARPEHPLHALLHDRPNGWQTSAEFRQMMEGFRQTHGKAYARIVSGLSRPDRAGAGPSRRVPPLPHAAGVAYRWTPPDGGAARTLLQHEVLYLRDGPPRRGNLAESIGKVELGREDIGLVMATASTWPGSSPTTPCPRRSSPSPPRSATRPPASCARPGSAATGAGEPARDRHPGRRWTSRRSANNDDAQVVEVHNMAVRKLARRFGVPGFLIGETGDTSNFGTGIEQQSIGFITYYMRPKFVVWEQALNAVLMSDQMRRRFYFEFNIDGLLRGDFKTRMESYALLIQWGLCTVNEIRKLMNLPPVEGGDERLQPLNMAPASQAMDVLLKTTPAANQRDLADQVTRMLSELLKANGVRLVPAA
jgi:hypothetical protein